MEDKLLFEKMAKYNITLRKIPLFVCSLCSFNADIKKRTDNPTYEEIIKEMPINKYKEGVKSGFFSNDFYYKNGFLIRKFRKEIKKTCGGWIAKIDNTNDSIQQWNKKNDFWGDTAEDAINKAVEYAERRKKEREEMRRNAGI